MADNLVAQICKEICDNREVKMNNTHKYPYLLHNQTTAIADPAADIGEEKKAQTILKADL